jgi:hypothetical protein
MLSFSVYDYAPVEPQAEDWQRHTVHVIQLQPPPNGEGRTFGVLRLAGTTGAIWSPDSRSISVIREPHFDMGTIRGVPALIDVPGGSERRLSAEPLNLDRAPAFNADGTKLLLTTKGQVDEQTWGSIITIINADGVEVERIAHPGDGSFGSPRWAPDGDRIAMHYSRRAADGRLWEPRYVLYDLATRQVIGETEVPRASDKIGGRCGGTDMWRSDWSRDGRRLLYAFTMGDTGANGIWVWDTASGTQKLVPAANAGPAAPGSDGHFAFSASAFDRSYIFIGDEGGGFPRLLTDGQSPAWSP